MSLWYRFHENETIRRIHVKIKGDSSLNYNYKIKLISIMKQQVSELSYFFPFQYSAIMLRTVFEPF